MTDKAKAAYAALEPSDLINRHPWLFRDTWVEESADELEQIEIDLQKREERIQKMRVDAMREIRDQRGFPELLELAASGKASFLVGFHAARDLFSEAALVEFLRLALQSVLAGKNDNYSYKNAISGAICAIPDENKRESILNAVATGLSEIDKIQLMMLAPFSKGTWKLIDALGAEAQAKYWLDVVPGRINHDTEGNEAVERLLKADRPRAAFSCV